MVDNGDGIGDAGESSVSESAGASWAKQSQRQNAYRHDHHCRTPERQHVYHQIPIQSINAPTIVGEHDFTTQSKSTPGGTLTNLTAGSPTIKVGVVPVGVVSISTTAADGTSSARSRRRVPALSLGNVTLTYTATATDISGRGR